MSDCIFCKIARGEIPSNKVYEDDLMYAFHDINPQAPVHVLMIPKQHLDSANAVNADNSAVVAHIFSKVSEIAAMVGVREDGYRIINNCGENGGQTVKHLHFHLLGGKDLGEKLV